MSITDTDMKGYTNMKRKMIYTVSMLLILIIVAAIATLFTKSQHMREIWFFLMSGGALLKILTMEISRILM